MKNSIYISIFLMLFPILLIAQDEVKPKVDTDLGLKLTSRHYWRGIPVSSAPCFEGSLALKTGGFEVGYWGGYAFDNTYSEFDFYTSYSFKNFKISLWDLYVIGDEDNQASYNPNQKYGNFNRETTSHNFDLTLAYNFGEKFPLNVAISTMVWGADRDENGDQRYSTYLELGYPVKINDKSKLDFFLGTVLNDKETVYGESFGVVHTGVTGTRKVKFTDSFSLPVSATIAINPQREIGYLILAISL